MAHRESIQSPELELLLGGEPFFWTVSSSVGYTCRNKTEDVLLVQFFLNRIIDEVFSMTVADVIAGEDVGNTPFKGIPKRLDPDGDFGGKTWGAIKWFQRESRWCVVDGMVSASDGTKALTPKQKMWYTMNMLNAFYREAWPQYYSDIRSDPTLPSILCHHLSGPLPDLV